MLKDKCKILNANARIIYTSLALLYEGSNNERGAESECLKPILSIHSQRRQWQPTPVLLPGKSHGRRSLVGCSPWGHEELDTTEWLHFHFSLSMHWRRKWQPTPVFLPGESQGRGSLVGCGLWGRRVRHNWSNLAAAAAEDFNKPFSQCQHAIRFLLGFQLI